MKPVLHQGQLITWKDERGFGFIKPDDGSKEIFIHISALKGAGRRPKVGDTILYERVKEADGKFRASKASIKGVEPKFIPTIQIRQVRHTRQKKKKRSLLETAISIGVIACIALIMHMTQNFSFAKKPGCNIKGNISHNSGAKLYHLPGMEDYKSTIINPQWGERWFCTESEAIANGWKKAPR